MFEFMKKIENVFGLFAKRKFYEKTCLPMRISCAPRIFTTHYETLLSISHHIGFMSTLYIDDFLLIGDSKNEFISKVAKPVPLMNKVILLI